MGKLIITAALLSLMAFAGYTLWADHQEEQRRLAQLERLKVLDENAKVFCAKYPEITSGICSKP